jgi:hypothetical protein
VPAVGRLPRLPQRRRRRNNQPALALVQLSNSASQLDPEKSHPTTPYHAPKAVKLSLSRGAPKPRSSSTQPRPINMTANPTANIKSRRRWPCQGSNQTLLAGSPWCDPSFRSRPGSARPHPPIAALAFGGRPSRRWEMRKLSAWPYMTESDRRRCSAMTRSGEISAFPITAHIANGPLTNAYGRSRTPTAKREPQLGAG